MRFRSLFGLVLAAALVPLLAAPTRAGNVRITVSGTITSASAGMGYSVGDPVSFFWDVNDYAPQTPVGTTSSVEHRWTQETAGTEPKLFANVGGTGIGGTFQEGPGGVPWDRVRVGPYREELQNLGNDLEVQMRIDGFNTTSNNRGIFLTANPSFLITTVYFDGDIASVFPQSVFPSGGPLPNPTVFLSDYFGTYDVLNQGFGQTQPRMQAFDGLTQLTANFAASSVNIAPVAPVPEPSTWAMGAGGLACAAWGAWRRRRRA